MRVWDAPTAVAASGSDVIFTTAWLAVRRYSTATGAVTPVLAVGDSGHPTDGRLSAVAISSNGGIGYIDRSSGTMTMQMLDSATGWCSGWWNGDPATGVAADGDGFYFTFSSGKIIRGFVSNTSCGTQSFLTGGVPLRAPAVVGEGANRKLVGSDANGVLYGVAIPGGGALAPWNSVNIGSPPLALAALGSDLVAALSDSVRLFRADGSTRLLAAAPRSVLATVRLGDKLYLASNAVEQPVQKQTGRDDGALVEVAGEQSRILARGWFLDAHESGDKLLVSDCYGSRIYTLDPTSGAQADLVAAPELQCPTALHVNAAGDVYWIQRDLAAPPESWTPDHLGRHTAAGAVSYSFASSYWLGHQMTDAADKLLVPDYGGLAMVDASAGGAMATLISSLRLGRLAAMNTAPDGSVHAVGIGGSVMAIDVAGGSLRPWGSMFASVAADTTGVRSFAFAADGAVVAWDPVQAGLVAVAP